MKLIPITIVFVAPRRIRKSLLFFDFIKLVPITAAWPEPIPGRRQQSGEAIVAASKGLRVLNLLIFNFWVVCSGIFVFVWMLMIKADAPKSPDNIGRKGWLIFEFKTAKPKNPESVKTIIAITFSLSFEIKKIVDAIRI